MRIPLSWISLYTPLHSLLEENSIKQLAHIYSTHTAEIDGIEEFFIDKVVVGKVISCEKHPESKKLSIVRVFLGEYGEETILTGAENIVDAKYVTVAMVGAVLPGDFTIAERPMAGMISRGMICGADEIGLSKEKSTGIMILEEQWDIHLLEKMIGKSFFDLTLPIPGKNGEIYEYKIGEPVFEIDNKFITNRPDLFSVVGNAREFGAVFDLPFSAPVIPANADRRESQKLDTKIETKNCLSYHLLAMKNVEVQKSPLGISLMMDRAGLSVKMDLVDLTNVIMAELGQPMHVFDGDQITGNITVRQAKNGEKILALNNVVYELTTSDMVIADERGPVAIAGVIGGMESAVSESTKNIIWESACFDATAVRLTAQRHGIRTDASTRYEKSLDPLLAGTTFIRVKEYLEFLSKSYEISGESHYLDETRVQSIKIEVTYDFINMKAGVEVPKERVNSILEKLGFILESREKSFTVSVPSWRASKDINIKEDIVEEVSRIYGYDTTPLTSLDGGFTIGNKNTDANLRNTILSHFLGEKWNEIYTYSFTNEKLESQVLKNNLDDAISVINAYNEEYTHMRQSLAPRLLLAASENTKFSKELRFFEIGKVYSKSCHNNHALLKDIEMKPFLEKKEFAGIMIGGDIESLRKALESLFEKILGYIPPVHMGNSLSLLHPNASGYYALGDLHIAEFGQVHPAVLSSFGLDSGFYFECDFSLLEKYFQDKEVRFSPISRYQTIPRELNFVMDIHTPTGEVARTLDALHPWITEVSVDSVFEEEKKIGVGKKSVNFSFILSNHDATISDDEALHVQNLIIEEMGKKNYQLRS